jgi:hypothetical protein
MDTCAVERIPTQFKLKPEDILIIGPVLEDAIFAER